VLGFRGMERCARDDLFRDDLFRDDLFRDDLFRDDLCYTKLVP